MFHNYKIIWCSLHQREFTLDMNPCFSRMVLAQLFICLNLSGPNCIPPYHRDTTTTTSTAPIIYEINNIAHFSQNQYGWRGISIHNFPIVNNSIS